MSADEADRDGNTPLLLACKGAATDAIPALLEVGCNPHTRNKFGMNAVSLAASCGKVSVLLEIPDDVDAMAMDSHGRCALHYCCEEYDEEDAHIATELLRRGEDCFNSLLSSTTHLTCWSRRYHQCSGRKRVNTASFISNQWGR